MLYRYHVWGVLLPQLRTLPALRSPGGAGTRRLRAPLQVERCQAGSRSALQTRASCVLGSEDEARVLQCHGDGQCQALHASSLPNASLSCALGFGGVYWLSLPSGQPRGPRGGVEGQCQSRRPGPWLLMCRGPCGLRPRLPPSPAQASGLPPVSGGDGSISVTVELEDLRQGPEWLEETQPQIINV